MRDEAFPDEASSRGDSAAASTREHEVEAAFMRLRVRAAEYDDADLELILDEFVQTRVERAEAERVIRVTSGWNPDRVSTLEAIGPALRYLQAKAERG